MIYLHLAGAIILAFYVVLLLTRRHKTLPDGILAVWLLFLLMNIVSIILVEGEVKGFGLILELSEASIFIHGPLLLFYTQSLTRSDFHFKFLDGLHFLPFIIALTVLWAFLGIENIALPNDLRMGILVTKMTSIAVYVILTLHRLFQYQREIPNYFSFTERIQLTWLQLLCWGSAALLLIGVVSQLLFYLAEVNIPYYGGLYSNIGASLFAIILAFYGVRQNHFLSEVALSSGSPPLQEDAIAGKEQALEPEKEALQRHYYHLVQFMLAEKPFLDQNLTLFRLASLAGMTESQLSQTINTIAEKNFFDFVNYYRVEGVKQKIREGNHTEQTLLAIAMDCGFNSKASFNRAFKKFTGLTPSEYKKRN